MKVVFLIIYFWEVKTISQDKSMNLDGSLDDDDDDGKKVELLLLSLCVMVWKLSLLGLDIPMSFSAATRKLEKILFTINCSLHNFHNYTSSNQLPRFKEVKKHLYHVIKQSENL